MAEKRGKKTSWEMMMVAEWVAQTFPDARWETNVRLGPVYPRNSEGKFTKEELNLLGVWRRIIDAIIFLPDRLILVEAVLKSFPGKLSILKYYERLVPQTPELVEYKDLRVDKVLLYAVEDPTLNLLARDEGILPIHFVPSCFEAWFATLTPRAKRMSDSAFLR